MHSFKAMNTTMHTWGLSLDNQIYVESWFTYVERKLSRFQAQSELSQLNRSPSKPFFMSALMTDVMQQSLAYYEETNGIFNPFLGKVLSNVGYRQSFEQMTGYPSITQHDVQSSSPPVQFDSRMKCVTLEPTIEVDFGGIAKAWSAAYACKKLQDQGIMHGAIDAGGDIVLWGKQSDLPKEIAIAHPREPDIDIVTISSIDGLALATSSIEKRKWQTHEGHKMHHLIDPRTQLPANTDFIQVTVIAPQLTTAEIYAKCILILGSEQGIPWIETHKPELAVIAVKQDMSIIFAGNYLHYAMKGV